MSARWGTDYGRRYDDLSIDLLYHNAVILFAHSEPILERVSVLFVTKSVS